MGLARKGPHQPPREEWGGRIGKTAWNGWVECRHRLFTWVLAGQDGTDKKSGESRAGQGALVNGSRTLGSRSGTGDVAECGLSVLGHAQTEPEQRLEPLAVSSKRCFEALDVASDRLRARLGRQRPWRLAI